MFEKITFFSLSLIAFHYVTTASAVLSIKRVFVHRCTRNSADKESRAKRQRGEKGVEEGEEERVGGWREFDTYMNDVGAAEIVVATDRRECPIEQLIGLASAVAYPIRQQQVGGPAHRSDGCRIDEDAAGEHQQRHDDGRQDSTGARARCHARTMDDSDIPDQDEHDEVDFDDADLHQQERLRLCGRRLWLWRDWGRQ